MLDAKKQKNIEQASTPDFRSKKAIKAASLSIFSNSILVTLKLSVGLMTNSVSVVSEAAHSGIDLAASWIAYFSVRAARAPADYEHPYGHGKIESLSGLFEALLILPAAGIILYSAIHRIVTHAKQPFDAGPGFVIMLFATLLNFGVANYLHKVSKETDSLALEADAAHLSADVITSTSVLIGLGLAWLFHLPILDPIVAIVVAIIIGRTGIMLVKSVMQPLLDAQLPEADLVKITTIFENNPQVLSYHKLRTRKSGHMRYLDVHILIDDDTPFVDAHTLSEELELKIRDTLQDSEVTIHMEPYKQEMRNQQDILDEKFSKKNN